jgi:hypothetical protein
MMMSQEEKIEINTTSNIELETVEIFQERFFKLSQYSLLRPFFMSIVSDSDHWMFISSNGGITAGRKNPEYALFPYYTDDKITEFADITGSKTIFQIQFDDKLNVWEPFSDRNLRQFCIKRNLYKGVFGNKIIFEEINLTLGLTFKYQWASSNEYGFVKTSELINHSGKNIQIHVLDGIQNLLPANVNSDLQRASSNLVDAYKRNELHLDSGVGIYALSAIIVDKAEPSESLKSNVVWSKGLEKPNYLVSSIQVYKFRENKAIETETDIKGEKGAYFVNSVVNLDDSQSKQWHIIANVNQSQSQIIELIQNSQQDPNIIQKVLDNIDEGTENLKKLNASADGLMFSADQFDDYRHFSNVLFNIMRGGIFDNDYNIDKSDFITYLRKSNQVIFNKHSEDFDKLPDTFSYLDLHKLLDPFENPILTRLSIEYLPLKFSRRHGDPSRPWNIFSINTRNEDGSKVLDYQGNWRDIFQNWESLAYAYPMFIEGMIYKFLNSSTFDGYNPYRIAKIGFDWEIIEPDDPWSYIGYWGDHQIIYLSKFLEFFKNFLPGKLNHLMSQEIFVYAAVPYKIKNYQDILKNPKDTIVFDHKWDAKIREQRNLIGADGALLRNTENKIHSVSFIEKILATVLSKMSNFIPEGGIWMNTQRPEWNDANNALVGNGVSVVTLLYLRRFLKVFENILNQSELNQVYLSSELVAFYHEIREQLLEKQSFLNTNFSDEQRKEIVDVLGKAGSDYRNLIYQTGFLGEKMTVSLIGLKKFVNISLEFIEHTIKANQRKDAMYHAYNLLSVHPNSISIDYLNEMLEGQVAVLSSGFLTGKESLQLLDALKKSRLFRADQYSYILYPNVDLPKFLEKNIIPENEILKSKLVLKLLSDNNTQIVERDVIGQYHFNANFKNKADLLETLNTLDKSYIPLIKEDTTLILDIFEKVFNHKAFTGRSGTFFAFEGLGSIYWHMVSKLHLAVQETCLAAINNQEDTSIISKLMDHYFAIQAGIGVHKSPELYGAFPTDPYSHTPMHKGAQQPGMTGQVKEDILVKWGELGVYAENGQLCFNPQILQMDAFDAKPKKVEFYPLNGDKEVILLQEKSLMFSFCQTPIIYEISNIDTIEIEWKAKDLQIINGFTLDIKTSQTLFNRTGEIKCIKVKMKPNRFKQV